MPAGTPAHLLKRRELEGQLESVTVMGGEGFLVKGTGSVIRELCMEEGRLHLA